MTTEQDGARAGRREWFALAVLCLPSMLATVDLNVVILALPRIAASLRAGAIEQLWISDIYAFMIAGFLVTMGTLGDRVGRRRVLLSGAAGFIAASVLAAFSTSALMLIVSRALIGVAAATIMPCVLALIRNMFSDPRQMGVAMGAWGMSIMVGLLIGPVVGGLLLSEFWWGSVFLIAVPVMAALLLLGPVLIPESRDPRAGRLDPLSVVLWLAGVLPLVYGIKELARNGWQPLPAAAACAGAAFIVVFVWRQRALPSPLLDVRLFASRMLWVTCLLVLLMTIVLAGTGLEATVFMQSVKGLTPLHVALLTLIPAGITVVVSNAAPALARVVRPGRVLAAGAVIAVAGMALITQQSGSAGVAVLITGMTLVFVCGGAVGPLSSFLIMTAVPPEKAGSAGSLAATCGELGQALGVAALGVLGTAVYRARIVVPAGVPAPAAAAARQSIIGTAAAAQHLPGHAGVALARSADAAFLTGLHVVALTGLVVFVGLAVVAGAGLRRVPRVTGLPGMPPSGGDGAAGAAGTAGEAGAPRTVAA